MKPRFPIYRQLDEMDCGPTCLQMIAAYYGKHLTLQQVRELTNVDRDGVSLFGLTAAAEAMGMHTLSVRISIDDLLRQAKFPCIVHFNDHFVVLYAVEGDRMHVADPGPGAVTYTKEQFLKKWRAPEHGHNVGIALLLEPAESFQKTRSQGGARASHGIRELIGYLAHYKLQLFKIVICLLIGSSIQLLFPFVTQSVVDKGIANKNLSFLYLVLAGQLVLTFSRTTVEFIRRWIVLKLSNLINLSILSEFLGKLMQLPVSFFEQKKVGDILRRIDDHARIERFITSSSLSFSFSQITLVIYSAVLCYYNVPIFLVFITASAAYVTYILTFMKRKRELDYRSFDDSALMDSSVIEIAEGIQEVKLNNFEEQSLASWKQTQKKIFDIRTVTTRIQQYQEGGGTLINETRNVLITFMAASQVIEGSMTVGAMLAIQFMIGQLQAPIMDLLNFSKDYQEAKISLERIGEVKHMAGEDEDLTPSGPADINSRRDITFENISFSYPGRHSSVILDSINVRFPHGKVTALVGKSGSGKSSMLKLLMKFYRPSAGKILIGETNLSSVHARSWRRQCGVVMQDGFIFSETIARNIVLANDFDKQKLSHVIEITNLKDFIEEVPFGINTKIGPSGTGISAGQRQRILIARAIYKDPACLILDEATSALDAVNERAIISNISRFGQGRTTIVIAHRLSTIRSADQIIALDHGSIAETGTHDELIARRGVYYDLVTNQMHSQDVSNSYHEPSKIP